MKPNWIDLLPSNVRTRLAACHSRRDDLPILVACKWRAMVANGAQEEGFVKEDALCQILELLDCNGQFFDLDQGEYDQLKH